LTLDFNSIEYENAQVKLIANRRISKIETPGIVIDEVEEKREFSAPYWQAQILRDIGLAKIAEDGLTSEEWTQTHFKERFNVAGPPTVLPKDFYRRAYVSLTLSIRDSKGDQSKIDMLNRLQARFREIIESRLGKVTRLASFDSTPQQGVLQPEELALWVDLQRLIVKWRKNIRSLGE